MKAVRQHRYGSVNRELLYIENGEGMKRFISLFISALFFVMFGATAVASDLNIQTGMNFNYWDSDADDTGAQLYVPVTVTKDHDDFSFKLLTAFAYTYSDPSHASSRSLSCVIDTKLNFSYTLLDKLPADLIFGLDFNVPTGKSKLDNEDLSLLLDPDLVEISRYGEGFNVNPTVAVAKVWDIWAAGIGIGYLFRGEYDFSELIRDYEPGNILSITGEVVRLFSSDFRTRLYGEFARYEKDKVRGEDYYEESDFLLVGMDMHYYQDKWDALMALEGIFRGKSKFQEEGAGLSTEDRASYGDEYNLLISGVYYWSEKTTVRPQFYYLWVFENDYASSSPFYIGDRQKASIQVSVLREISPLFDGEITLRGYILDVERNWYHSDDRTFRGFICSILLTRRF